MPTTPPEVGLHDDKSVLACRRRLACPPAARQHRRHAGGVQPHLAARRQRHEQAQVRHVGSNDLLRLGQPAVAHGLATLQAQPQQEVDRHRQVGARCPRCACSACCRLQVCQVLPHHAPQLAVQVGQQELEAALADACVGRGGRCAGVSSVV